MSTAAAFESMASTYDRSFGENPIARALRQRVWDELFMRLPAGARVLDLGCGTGIDLTEMARRGYAAIGVDGSAAMLREAERKKTPAADGAIETRELDLNDGAARRAFLKAEPFDAVLSNFGALNCIDDLGSLAGDLAEALPARAPVVVVILGKLCPWDIVYHMLRARPRRAFLRWSRGPVSVALAGRAIRVRYHGPRALCRIFAPWFRCRRVEALGALLPPPYLARRLPSSPTLWESAARIEKPWAGCWPINRLGDHFLVVLERT